MKTKYDKLVEARKTQLNRAEADISDCNVKIFQKEQQLQRSIYELAHTELPKSGHISILRTLAEGRRVQALEIERLRVDLESLQSLLASLKENYKILSIEFEKAKHLQGLDIKKRLKELKLLEQKELDEVASMLYNNKKEV